MSLRDKIDLVRGTGGADSAALFERFGVLDNPFPAASQTSNNPHLESAADEIIQNKIAGFFREQRSQVVVIEGTQGVGKTNILNHYERELADLLPEMDGFYVVRYMADPESSFEGILRRLFQELGTRHLVKLSEALATAPHHIEAARGYEIKAALHALARAAGDEEVAEIFLEWLTGSRVLNRHKHAIRVQFRLDTVESKTAALRDIVYVSSDAGVLHGIFLLLDELEKQDGVLGPTLVTRYLSSMRALIDALPQHLFMMIAVTPDALRRYSNSLPAFRSRLEDRVTLMPLSSWEAACKLADFYVEQARARAEHKMGNRVDRTILPQSEVHELFEQLLAQARRRGDDGVRQREFLHQLNKRADEIIRQVA